jgi:hypothetical protein
MSEPQHTYPSRYAPGQHWAMDEAWAILDAFTPGLLPDDVRILLAGMIFRTLMRLARDGHRQPPATPQEEAP